MIMTAKEFIQDCTKNYSNEIIGGGWNNGEHVRLFVPWITIDQAMEAVEMAKREIVEQMKKDSIDGTICLPFEFSKVEKGELIVKATVTKDKGFKFGDDVKVIIIKKE